MKHKIPQKNYEEFKQDVIIDKQDMTHLTWTKIRHSSGTNGSFLKSTSEVDGRKVYYKMSNYNDVNGVYGHECINEIIVDRLLTILGIEHLNYQLIHADVRNNGKVFDTWICASYDYKCTGESKIALDTFYQLERNETETPFDFCKRNRWQSYIYKMLVVDYLILNRDRHGANIEVLRSKRDGKIRIAPVFDHGLSLLFSCHTEEDVRKYDVMEDKQVQCFVGSNSSKANLNLIPKGKEPNLNSLKNNDKRIIMKDLDYAIPAIWLDKIWEMIWKRWKYYESFCNKR